MFGLFKKKEQRIKVQDSIWMTEKAKWQACLELQKINPNIIFIAWFEETKNGLINYLLEHNAVDCNVYRADVAHISHQADNIIFVEHHPLQSHEQTKFIATEIQKAQVYSSLDEPIFELFGGKNISQLMQKMGAKENEMISHTMVSASIVRAQKKIAEKTSLATSARSQRTWLINNAGIGDKV
jgi:hypothetical protein